MAEDPEQAKSTTSGGRVAVFLGAVVTVLALVAAATGHLKQIVDNLRTTFYSDQASKTKDPAPLSPLNGMWRISCQSGDSSFDLALSQTDDQISGTMTEVHKRLSGSVNGHITSPESFQFTVSGGFLPPGQNEVFTF